LVVSFIFEELMTKNPLIFLLVDSLLLAGYWILLATGLLRRIFRKKEG